MTKDEIIDMAKSINEDWWLDDIDLKAFAKLVAERERERLTDAAMKAAEKAVDLAIALEREACAVICETYWNRPNNGMSTEEEVCGSVTAELIRARGLA